MNLEPIRNFPSKETALAYARVRSVELVEPMFVASNNSGFFATGVGRTKSDMKNLLRNTTWEAREGIELVTCVEPDPIHVEIRRLEDVLRILDEAITKFQVIAFETNLGAPWDRLISAKKDVADEIRLLRTCLQPTIRRPRSPENRQKVLIPD